MHLEPPCGEFWERLVESAVGAHLANTEFRGECAIYYCRHGNDEVDFVARAGRRLTAIEVKSGRATRPHRGTAAFGAAFGSRRSLLVGGDRIGLGQFLNQPVRHWATGVA